VAGAGGWVHGASMTRANTILDIDRFFRIDDGCWLWFGPKHRQGYGHIKIKGKMHTAHRLMFQYFYGVDPGEYKVCHTCDTPACVRPNHLFLGTQLDNVRDCIAKGRLPQCREDKPPPATESAARNRRYRQRLKLRGLRQ
jgi:HNH endonuclease